MLPSKLCFACASPWPGGQSGTCKERQGLPQHHYKNCYHYVILINTSFRLITAIIVIVTNDAITSFSSISFSTTIINSLMSINLVNLNVITTTGSTITVTITKTILITVAMTI